MAGLVKAKKYDWKDSNLALFGSDTEKNVRALALLICVHVIAFMSFLLLQVKKSAAETEPAWKGAGDKVGLQIWRIVKFKVDLYHEFERRV